MAKVRNIKRCEGCPKWIRSTKEIVFCEECTRLNAMMNSLWKTPEMPELAELGRLIDSFPTKVTK